ncbi:nuclear transport factor 2 family protein [Synechococcus sp. BS55D]|uniref:nuclear transport factor 2 family protein n=1 Tax=Synechococcus sp. BS55D TaxID=2055943 RepID=UPI00103C0EBC|nr:nuclear transport factor 2 family protein [Synechococcus sp. BS55D]TCD57003.1 hypothetical protein CWE16_04130 [Synechococcus sp. BS55D]
MTAQDNAHAELIKTALQVVLAEHDTSRLEEFFCADAIVQINERRLVGLEAIASRLAWIREHRPKVSLQLERVFFQGDRGFDHHTTTLSDGDSSSAPIKVFAYIEMRDGKIALYEDVSIALDGQDHLPEATGIKA